ncbi:MAG: type II toxin-antitoxin system RelE/ParE family toxin [Actinomycetota bacterium]|nr:type II toxin-antitoxin system RelE/ParE family toxin [Actinomycetota bacterium]
MTPPPYEVAWTGAAKRALTRLPEKVGTAVIEFCYRALAENPSRVGKSLKFDLTGLQSARRGDFRVIYRVSEADRRIDIVAIEHRSHVYRPR